MIIDCISDLHGELPDLEGGDLLIIAGDITRSDKIKQWKAFFEWLEKQSYKMKVLVPGNHDGFLEDCCSTEESRLIGVFEEDHGLEILIDSGVEFEGVKVWGSPWTPNLYDWHFMLPRGEKLKEKWDQIPQDTNILVTHGPPHAILDEASMGKNYKKHCGCVDLREAVQRVKPRLHVFGHVHESYGRKTEVWGPEIFQSTQFVNCSLMNENYKYVNKPIRVDYEVYKR